MSNATSCLLLRHVAGVDGAVRHVERPMLQVACCLLPFDMSKQHVERCFDMLLVWTGLNTVSGQVAMHFVA